MRISIISLCAVAPFTTVPPYTPFLSISEGSEGVFDLKNVKMGLYFVRLIFK